MEFLDSSDDLHQKRNSDQQKSSGSSGIGRVNDKRMIYSDSSRKMKAYGYEPIKGPPPFEYPDYSLSAGLSRIAAYVQGGVGPANVGQ